MKKRILSMILMLTMVMGIFTGCGTGAGGSANEITVSEMLNSIIEEKGEVVMYRGGVSADGYAGFDTISDKSDGSVVVYNGETLIQKRHKHSSPTLLGLLKGEEEADYVTQKELAVDLDLSLDENDNVVGEVLHGREKMKTSTYAVFDNCTHVEINGKSYMMFELYIKYFRSDNEVDTVHLTFIEDTEYTKDKTVVFDSKDTEGVTVGNYAFVPKPEK